MNIMKKLKLTCYYISCNFSDWITLMYQCPCFNYFDWINWFVSQESYAWSL